MGSPRITGGKIREQVEAASGAVVPATVSIGLASGRADPAADTEKWVDALIGRADACMYRAKETGRNAVVL